MMVLRTWRCTAGHVALTVLEDEKDARQYDPKCHCGLPVSERTPLGGS